MGINTNINTNSWHQEGNSGTQKSTKKLATLQRRLEIIYMCKSASAASSAVKGNVQCKSGVLAARDTCNACIQSKNESKLSCAALDIFYRC